MLETAGAILAYAYSQNRNWGRMLDDLIAEVYQRSGASVRALIQECVNQVLNEAAQSKECQPSPGTDPRSLAAETAV